MKTRHALLAGLAALSLLAAPAAFAISGWTPIVPSGKIAVETRAVTGFTAIDLSLPGKVELRQGSPETMTIEADDNLLPEIETVVGSGTLRIRFHRKVNVVGRATIRVKVTAPGIESLAIAGSGDISAGTLAVPALSVSISGSGDVSIADIQAEALRVSISGSGTMEAAGRATELAATIAGSGDLVAGRLESKRATVSIAGSGDAAVRARESLVVTIAGSGDVRYHGDPAITKRIAGSGSLRRLGPAP